MKEVNILGFNFKIDYVDNASEVDIHKRESYVGQIDYWSKSIRIYNKSDNEQKCETLIHEILHGIAEYGCINEIKEEKIISRLSILIYDTLNRNGLLKNPYLKEKNGGKK